MKTQLTTLLLSLTLFGSCREDPEAIGPCGVKNPIEELSWLKEEIELYSKSPNLQQAYFTTTYKGQRVFWYYSFFTIGSLTYRTCDGKYQYIPSPLPEDKESKAFIRLLNSPAISCPYLLWSTPNFRTQTPCP